MRRAGSSLRGSEGAGGQIGNVAGLEGGTKGSAGSGPHSIGNVAGLGSGGSAHSGRVRSRTGASFTQRSARPTPGGPNGSGGSAGGGPILSRRNLVIGAVGVGALAALGGGAAFLSSQSSQDDEIVVLDEATSALDSVTERKIQSAFDALAQGRTTLMIAHRLSTIRSASRIIVIDDNHIAEEGTHEQLLQQGGGYAKLFEIQSRYYKEGKEF